VNDRRRNALILLLVAGLLAASAVVITTKKTFLGLDLKGGVELVYQAKPTQQAKVDSTSLNRSIDIMRRRVDSLGVAEPTIQTTGADQVDVALPAVSNAKRAIDQVGKTAQLYFYDWEANVLGPNGQPAVASPAVTGDPSPGSSATGLGHYAAVQRAAQRPPLLHKGATTLAPGCTAALNASTGCVFGQWYLLDTTHQKVLRGPEDTQANLGADSYKPPPGVKLQIVHVNPGTVVVEATPDENSATGAVTKQNPDAWYVLNDNPVLTGADIRNPAASQNSTTGQPNVVFGFDGHGKTVFHDVTRTLAQRGQNQLGPGVSATQARQHFAIVLDNQLITVPYIDFTQNPDGIDTATGSEIDGGFTAQSAQNLASELQSGALPLKLVLISNSQVSASLGKTALNQGLIAGLVGFAVVCLFLLVFYRVLGLIAIGGLIIYGVYFFGLIKLIPVTLTLAGIAGLILTIGVAADANIVIFERVKEEIRGGRSIAAGIATGYKRGFAAIVDANVVTIMVAFILFVLSTADVKGFALTLGIGTIVSLFTAVLATQAALGTMGRSRLISSPAAVGAGPVRRKWTFDFMGASKWFFSFSGVILLIGALAIGGRGLNFGIDFKSGTRLQTGLVAPATVSQVRGVLSGVGYPDAQIQGLRSPSVGGSGFQISTPTLDAKKVAAIQTQLNSRFGVRTGTFSNTTIGPTFGQTIASAAIKAIIASLLVISLYIALRFEWKYAIPVLIALMHDILITAGVYSLTGRQVTASTVAALLTILGYSLYDTIIVFDRVRENVPRMPRAAFSQIVNRSMSEVLTRSLATSFCTLLPIAALLLFGGATLSDFAFALLIGVASGAYSSIFIASPVLTHWKEREAVYRNRRARIIRDLGAVPAYATAAAGAPADVEPVPTRRRRRGSLTAPEEPGEQISQEEFDELVRDLDVEQQEQARAERAGGRSGRPRAGARDGGVRDGGARDGGSSDDDARTGRGGGSGVRDGAAGARSGRGAPVAAPDAPPAVRNGEAPSGERDPAERDPATERDSTPELDPAADALPEDVVMRTPQRGPSRPAKSRGGRNRRHGRPR
jgi:SecD/SecF fusion protein